MICAVMQPTYFPWLGYFDLIDQADHFVFYDDVQYVKQSWQSRNKVLTSSGATFLTVPVYKSDLETSIHSIQIDYRKPWVKKHLKTIYFNYGKNDFFDEVYPVIEELLQKQYSNLAEFHIAVITDIAERIGIDTTLIKSSTLPVTLATKDRRLVEICNHLNDSIYISTLGASVYIEKESEGGELKKSGIDLLYHHYEHPLYPQRGSSDFLPYLCIIDLLMNVGFKNSLEVIRTGRRKGLTSSEIDTQHEKK